MYGEQIQLLLQADVVEKMKSIANSEGWTIDELFDIVAQNYIHSCETKRNKEEERIIKSVYGRAKKDEPYEKAKIEEYHGESTFQLLLKIRGQLNIIYNVLASPVYKEYFKGKTHEIAWSDLDNKKIQRKFKSISKLLDKTYYRFFR